MAIKYAPIWETLKKDSIVVLAVPIALHKKVIKEVIRLKDLDVGFKYEASLAHKKYRISYESTGARITIELKEFDDLKAASLDEF